MYFLIQHSYSSVHFCHFSEYAVVLDLIMSLPEELPFMDCQSLQDHFLQVYPRFNTKVNVPLNSQDSATTNEAAEGSSGIEEDEATRSSHLDDEDPLTWDNVGICPLNPLMVPLSLLARKKDNQSWLSFLGLFKWYCCPLVLKKCYFTDGYFVSRGHILYFLCLICFILVKLRKNMLVTEWDGPTSWQQIENLFRPTYFAKSVFLTIFFLFLTVNKRPKNDSNIHYW